METTKPYGIIYKATCNVTGMSYIGQTIKTLKRRIQLHQTGKYRSYFQNAIKVYGIEKFQWEIIAEGNSIKELNDLEILMIKEHHTHRSEGGYNLTWGGDGVSGYKLSDESIKRGIETKRKNGTLQQTDESKKKIGNWHRGKKMSENDVKKGVETRRKNNSYVVSEEAKRKGIETKKKNGTLCHNEETKAKMRERMKGVGNPMYGKIPSDEHKQKISNGLKGRVPWNKKGG